MSSKAQTPIGGLGVWGLGVRGFGGLGFREGFRGLGFREVASYLKLL